MIHIILPDNIVKKVVSLKQSGKILLFILSVILVVPVIACNNTLQPSYKEVNFDQLTSNPSQYNGQYIIVEAFYFHGFEVNVLCKNLKFSGYADLHLVPEGILVWVEGGIPPEIFNKLHEQQMMGSAERYGKLRVKGRFQYGDSYGHLGSYRYQVSPVSVELLPWLSPP